MCQRISEKRVTLKIKIEYYPELLTTGTIKLFGSTKRSKTNDETGKTVLMKQCYFVAILLLININIIQKLRLHLSQIIHLAIY